MSIKAVLIILTLLLFAVILKNPFKLGIQDWDLNYAYAFANNISILKYRQIPLWNPYHCGGITQIGNAVNLLWTPLYIPVLTFGPVLGYKIQFIIYILIGFISAFHLGKYFRISAYSSILISLVYVLSGLFFAPYSTGMPVFLPLMLLPLVCLFLYKAINSVDYFKPAILTGLIISLIFLSGFHYILHLLIFIFLIAIIKFVSSKNLNSFKIFLIIILTFCAISALKILPTLEMILRHPRYITEEISGYSLLSFLKSLLWPIQELTSFNNWGVADRNLLKGFSYNIDENSIYIGAIPFTLFILGVIKKVKKHKDLTVLLFLLIWLSFGLNVNLSIYGLLREMPLLNMMRIAQRFRYYLMIPLILFIGMGMDQLLKWVQHSFAVKSSQLKIFATMVIFFVGIELLIFDQRILKMAFNFPLPRVVETENFRQKAEKQYYDKNGFQKSLTNFTSFSAEFPYISGGWVSINCYEPQPVNISAISYNHPSYRGEYYLLENNGKINREFWSPNKLIFNLQLKKDDFLIINQNYDPGWKVKINSKNSSIINKDGLLSVKIPKGRFLITLYYLPAFFIIGFILSLISFLLICRFLLQPNDQNHGLNA